MIRVLSLGAGVQSTALALMAAHGEIKKPDYAVFADTGDERRKTYAHLEWLKAVVPFPIIHASRDPMSLSESTIAHYREEGGFDQTPPFFFPGGMLPKHCSKEWKTRVIIQYIRTREGLARRKRAPKELAVDMLIGISRDEVHRMKPSEVPWVTNCWPLIDRNMRRGDCENWLTRRGYPIPVRSACVYCPFRSDDEMAEIKADDSDDWERATSFDDSIRNGGNGTTGPLFVSRHLKPLREVQFGSQPSLFSNECEGVCGV